MDTSIQCSKAYTLTGDIENIDIDITQYNNQYIFKKLLNLKLN